MTGDCHGNFERFKPEYFPEQAQMTKRDIVICAGDFGGVWSVSYTHLTLPTNSLV